MIGQFKQPKTCLRIVTGLARLMPKLLICSIVTVSNHFHLIALPLRSIARSSAATNPASSRKTPVTARRGLPYWMAIVALSSLSRAAHAYFGRPPATNRVQSPPPAHRQLPQLQAMGSSIWMTIPASTFSFTTWGQCGVARRRVLEARRHLGDAAGALGDDHETMMPVMKFLLITKLPNA